jgi:DNA-directed RNA polymerase subunit RPC12/RpoP
MTTTPIPAPTIREWDWPPKDKVKCILCGIEEVERRQLRDGRIEVLPFFAPFKMGSPYHNYVEPPPSPPETKYFCSTCCHLFWRDFLSNQKLLTYLRCPVCDKFQSHEEAVVLHIKYCHPHPIQKMDFPDILWDKYYEIDRDKKQRRLIVETLKYIEQKHSNNLFLP